MGIGSESKLKILNKEIIDAIVSRTSLTADNIETWDIEKIEKELGIKAAIPKRYFSWEKGEKQGLQLSLYKFVPKEVFDKRERRLDAFLSKK